MSLPLISINDIVPNNVSVNIIERKHIDGNVSEFELEIISKIVKYFKPHTIFEFGTFDGRSTINMAINSPSETKIYTLDLPRDQKPKYQLADVGEYLDARYINKPKSGTRYKDKSGSEKIIQLYGDSATFDYSPYKGKIDLLFIDGSHAWQYTENDTEAALLMSHPGSIILWHDYASVWPDVTQVLNEYAQQLPIQHIKDTTLVILKKL